MMWHPCLRSRGLITAATILMLLDSRLAADQADKGTKPIFVTSGQEITPTAAPGSQLQYLNPGLADYQHYIASGGITTAVSPDGETAPTIRCWAIWTRATETVILQSSEKPIPRANTN